MYTSQVGCYFELLCKWIWALEDNETSYFVGNTLIDLFLFDLNDYILYKLIYLKLNIGIITHLGSNLCFTVTSIQQKQVKVAKAITTTDFNNHYIKCYLGLNWMSDEDTQVRIRASAVV